ncbi:hypothetical protein RIF29_11940 [Crotalaria pallida]|uniref:Uncharacterized protein n=1 Tax=Crotalaria pallida TaxID=3830 RepID=A0AAN9IMS8_CROPI
MPNGAHDCVHFIAYVYNLRSPLVLCQTFSYLWLHIRNICLIMKWEHHPTELVRLSIWKSCIYMLRY